MLPSMRSILFCLLTLLASTTALSATYFQESSGLTFRTTTSELGGSWRIATDDDLEILFGNNYSNPGPFNQILANAILGLGGEVTGLGNGGLSCDTSLLPPGQTCEDLQQVCNLNANFPPCETLVETDATQYTLSPFLYDSEGSGSPGYWDRYLLFGTYDYDYSGQGLWTANILSLAAPIGYDCEPNCGIDPTPSATLYVSEVPLPAGLPLMASALIGLLSLRKRK